MDFQINERKVQFLVITGGEQGTEDVPIDYGTLLFLKDVIRNYAPTANTACYINDDNTPLARVLRNARLIDIYDNWCQPVNKAAVKTLREIRDRVKEITDK